MPNANAATAVVGRGWIVICNILDLMWTKQLCMPLPLKTLGAGGILISGVSIWVSPRKPCKHHIKNQWIWMWIGILKPAHSMLVRLKHTRSRLWNQCKLQIVLQSVLLFTTMLCKWSVLCSCCTKTVIVWNQKVKIRSAHDGCQIALICITL